MVQLTEVFTSLLNPLNHQPDGTVTMNFPAGQRTVASLQQDGTLATRPEGTCGPWEKAVLVQGGLIFTNISELGEVAKAAPWYQV